MESRNADNSLSLQNVKLYALVPLASIGMIPARRKNEALHLYVHKSDLDAFFEFRKPTPEKEAQNPVL